ncbi:MAG: TonB-dependent receptor [Nibricoccus sp.]
MHTKTTHRSSVYRALQLLGTFGLQGLLPLAATAQTTPATPTPPLEDSTPIVLDKSVVTGSRIKNIDEAGPNPVTAFNRTTIEAAGFADVGEALRTLPMVSGSNLTPAASNNSFTPGASTVNLRGLGNNNVLVLLNGRRAAPLSTPGFDGLQTMFDFNSIPSAAVESIEVLKDGGSAIYGSDAVSGVINIKLRKAYNGLSTSLQFGNTTHTDSLERKFSLIAGSSKGSTSIVATVDYTDRHSIKDHDYAFSSEADTTSRGGADRRSYAGYPGLVYVPSLDDYYTLKAPKTNPALSDFELADVSHGSYNFQTVTDQIPETRNYGVYTRLTQDFTPYLYGFLELSFRRSQSKIGAAPSPVFNYNEHGDGPNTGYLNIPASNPNNPFGENLEDEWYARLVHAGNRVNDVTSDTPRGLVGIGGKIADSSWTWEVGAVHTRNALKNLNHGFVHDDLYQQALNGVTINGTVLYANPFGPEDPAVTAYYVRDNPESGKFTLRTYDFSATGDLFELPAGQLALAFGGEARSEKFESIRSPDSTAGNIIGGSEGSSIHGDRTVRAAYAELRIPIVKGLQAQVAGRFEHYSDFGSTTKPKYALSYRPTDWLLLRTSYGQSFLAPNLSYLYTAQVTQFSDNPLDDPKRPNDAARQIITRSGGNRDLQPEKTTTYYAGFQVEPSKGPMKGWAAGVDWFEFKQTNLIARLGEDLILANEDAYPGKVVRNPPAAGETVGIINYIVDTYTNIDRQTYRGIDSELSYQFKSAYLGNLRFSAAATYLIALNYNSDDYASSYNFPRVRGIFSVEWHKGNWSSTVFVSYIGRFDKYEEKGAVGKIGSQTLVNPQISYSGFYGIKTTLGARNVFDRDPPFDRHSSTGWDADVHNPGKAFVYVRLEKEF